MSRCLPVVQITHAVNKGLIMIKKRNLTRIYPFTLTMLASSILGLSQVTYALQAMADHDLRQVDGQDGLSINTEYGNIAIDELYWEDKAGTADNAEITLRAVAKGTKISKNLNYDPDGSGPKQAGDYTLGTLFEVQTGANENGQVGIDLNIKSRPSTISMDDFKICEGTDCESVNGRLAIQTGSDLNIGLKTADGLFNKNAQVELNLGFKNINIFTGLPVSSAVGETNYNQLILKNTNFNFHGKGVAYIDNVEGFMLNTNTGAVGKASVNQTPNKDYGYVDFSRVAIPSFDQTGAMTSTYYDGTNSTNSGLNLEFMLKTGAMDPTSLNTEGSKGLIRVGASGRMVNSFLQIRGVDTINETAINSVLGYASSASGIANTAPNLTTGTNKSIMGSTGVGLRLRGEFTRDGDSMLGAGANAGTSTKLEIGGAGSNTFGFEFSELSPLISNSKDRAYFDSGNVYINLAKTQHLQMPENTVLSNSRFGGTTINNTLTKSSDYIQQIHQRSAADGNPRSVVIAVRGADFQAVSKRGRFTSSQGVDQNNIISPTDGLNNEWGLGLPFYNMNSNIALYTTDYTGSYYTLENSQVKPVAINSASNRLGFALALSVEGQDKNSDGSNKGTKTTSIVVVDAKNDMYIGLRNIDMLLRGYGSIGLEGGQVNVDLPNLLMVMSAEIAGGFFPTYTNEAAQTGLINSFNSPNDVLFGVKLKLLGDMNFSLIPNNAITDGNRLSIVGRYNLLPNVGNTIQVTDPIDDSMIGLDNIQGLVEFNNAIVINKDTVGFNYGFEFNPAAGQTAAQREANVFRVKDINLYPPLAAINNRGQRLGEIVMTGGRLNMEMAIKPRN